ncbi:flavin-dependent monooxygenase QhpG [Chitinophaga sancti]|uniref:Dehydrogenase (Flavoprotein) n=1 Tax=Chitinophaga sancti TaxID=1004 RepID=A0A1K1RTB1_9BACT|nr:tryptophan 7-halogenase [Chitinophaga sancti]WQD62452.1 tryptophan 7-halogenase [Chitinophaga sancti]WQG91979.1 tryptophan 7-halogenase [Chitinophaga sancti]SFW75028.1 Dehydrogenase (flavoprotein) [Chitinophaga sancti]
MNTLPEHFDVFILGAGPAGLCAAIRLLDMGYVVGMIEQEQFPRPQIGESLSPGIHNIFEYLNAAHLLEDSTYIKNIPAKIIWESKEHSYDRPGPDNGGIVVDRSKLDQELLKFAVSKGLHLIQPAKLRQAIHSGNDWILEILNRSAGISIHSKIVLDARGRKGTLLNERLPIAPSAVAAWTHIDNAVVKESFIEAFAEGWLWGSPVSVNRYRIMAFTDPGTLKENSGSHLSGLMNKTALFAPFVNKIRNSSIETCLVSSFVALAPWDKQFVKIGEAAFTLDPLSSTGVEKAMRFSLQVAIAINTYLKDPQSEHPKNFYEEKLIESVVSHTNWTADYYRKAWPDCKTAAFWMKRASFQLDISKSKSDFTLKLEKVLNNDRPVFEKKQVGPIPVDYFLSRFWNEKIVVSPHVTFKAVYAIDHDCVVIRRAIIHPNLELPLVYLDQLELYSFLKDINGSAISNILDSLNRSMAMEKSKKMLVFLLSNRLLVPTR